MSVIDTLITDRTQADVSRVEELAAKGWHNMTRDEQLEWMYGNATVVKWSDGITLQCTDGILTLYTQDTSNRGAYTPNDWNRVESAVDFMSAELREFPKELKEYAKSKSVGWDKFFDVPYDPQDLYLTAKTDWDESDIWSVDDQDRYLGNVMAIRNALDYETDELPTSMDDLTYEDANAIEKALVNIVDAIADFREKTQENIDIVTKSFFYSDEIVAGEV